MKKKLAPKLNFVKTENPHLSLCREQSKPLAIIPAGQQGQSFCAYLQSHGVETALFVDNNTQKQGNLIAGKKVISLAECLSSTDPFHLLISTNEQIAELLVKQLQENGVPTENYTVIASDYLCLPPHDIDTAAELIDSNILEYETAYQLFADELSQTTFENILNYRMSFNTELLTEIQRPCDLQYFEPDIYAITSKDSFVDCGAFNGDTLLKTMSLVNNKIAAYYAFEPDSFNYSRLQVAAEQFDGMNLYNAGVAKENGTLFFEQNCNSYSRVVESDGVAIEVLSLDEILADRTVTMIKMDIEGAEYDALLGARTLIQSQKPVLAISVYHTFFDIVRLPLLIDSFGVPYRYYLRHYTNQAIETVLYAVCTEYQKGG